MPDTVFGSARLRGYRVVETAGIATALQLQILDRILAGLLWLPISLIEIAFRNAADRAVSEAHPAGEWWFLEEGRDGDRLDAPRIRCPAVFRGRRYDDTEDDPIAEAARMAARQLHRSHMTRDDVIAHLMLGFWVGRCADALSASGLQYWDLVAAKLGAPLNDPKYLEATIGRLGLTRNRVAHHEPLVFRAKHVFNIKTGEAKSASDLAASLEAALAKFKREVVLVTDTAKAIAPIASYAIEPIPGKVDVEVASLSASISTAVLKARQAAEDRRAVRAAKRAANTISTRRSESS